MVYSKLERLLNLTAVLLDGDRAFTRDELREKVLGYHSYDNPESFRTIFERDKDELRDMGIPIEVLDIYQTPNGEKAYRIDKERYYLRDPGLDPEEAAAVAMALAAVRLHGVQGTVALQGIGAGPASVEGIDPLDVPADPNLLPLFDAVTSRRAVRFTYKDEARLVDPYRLDFSRGRWYLQGYDHARAEERNFRLDRVQGAVVPEAATGAFNRPTTAVEGQAFEPWSLLVGDGAEVAEPITARILVDASHAPLARRTAPLECVVEHRPDGSVVLELEVTYLPGLRSFVLSFLDHAEILEPESLRADMVTWLEALR